MKYFFHNTTKKITVAFLDMFNNMKVKRYRGGDEPMRTINVPITFWNEQKTRTRIRADNVDDRDQLPEIEVTLPRITSMLSGISKRTSDNRGKFETRVLVESYNEDTGEIEKETINYNAIPYNFDYELSVWTRTLSDHFQLVENIVSIFNTKVPLTMSELSTPLQRHMYVMLEDNIDLALEDELSSSQTREFNKTTLSFTVEGYLYKPLITTGNIIKEITVDVVNWEGLNGTTISIEGENLYGEDIQISERLEEYQK